MKTLPQHIKDFLLKAESKALATTLSNNTNVVPISTITIKENTIVLVNYFMDKTLTNILSNNVVSFVAWTKMIGYQIKGTAEYKTDGSLFDEIKLWIHETLPERVVKGIIIITPQDIFDIAPGKDSDQQLTAQSN